MTDKPILVIGATGKVGRRVVAILSSDGHNVRAAGRRAEIPFDWQDRGNWPEHFTGVETAYVSYYPDLAAPGAEDDIRALIDVAQNAGLRRMVLLSGRGETGAQRCEEILAKSGLGHTLVRAAFFNQNFSEGLLQPAVMEGMIALPAGHRAEPFVDVDDIAEVCAAALVRDDHHDQLYELTGPRLLTFADAAREVGAAARRKVDYVPITLEQFRSAATPKFGADTANMLSELFHEVFDGRNEVLADGVQRALGRAPRDFSDFCAAAAAAGSWRRVA